MESKLITNFYVKKARKDRAGKAPIYFRITVNGKRAEISTNKKIEPDNWDSSSGKAAGRSESTRMINAQLTNLKNKTEKYFLKLDGTEGMISVHQIIDELRGKSKNQMTLIKAYNHHNNRILDLVGTDYSPVTSSRYKSSLNSLKSFLEEVLRKSDIRLCDLNHEFIEKYHTYLRSNKGLKHNSAAKNIKNLIRVINLSIQNSWIPTNPFKNFSCSYKENYRECLTQEEIDKLYEKDILVKRLEKVRDVYIFQIYTGLAYSDLVKLSHDDIQKGIDGENWITIFRKKTGGRSSIPLLPRAIEILEKYKIDPECISKGVLLPINTNQRMNGYLKELAIICKINKNLTTHLARHTFATTITLTNGVPIETVSKMLGHSNLKTTQIYSKVIDRKVSDDMRQLMNRKSERDNTKNVI